MNAAEHFSRLAAYNAWANEKIYAAAAGLPEHDLGRDVGLYFVSLVDTLSHILKTDRAWRFLIDGGALADLPAPEVFATFSDLRRARRLEDERLKDWIGGSSPASFDEPFSFTSGLGSLKGLTAAGPKHHFLTHLFNHQTHHRGQAHAALTRLGVREPQPLDLLVWDFRAP